MHLNFSCSPDSALHILPFRVNVQMLFRFSSPSITSRFFLTCLSLLTEWYFPPPTNSETQKTPFISLFSHHSYLRCEFQLNISKATPGKRRPQPLTSFSGQIRSFHLSILNLYSNNYLLNMQILASSFASYSNLILSHMSMFKMLSCFKNKSNARLEVTCGLFHSSFLPFCFQSISNQNTGPGKAE